MKVGFYGGLANNCYIFAKVLSNAGHDVVFIRDRSDSYAFSQPVWEDATFVMDYAEVAKSSAYSWEDWARIEGRQLWHSPAWLVDPLKFQGVASPVSRAPAWLRPLGGRYIRPVAHRTGVVAAMQSCDVLLVCGIEPAILAMMSGRPYIIWPHGGDIRVAAGLTIPPEGLRNRIRFEVQKTLLLAAYDKAAWVGTHDPKGLGGVAGDVRKALRKTSLIHLPIPAPITSRADQSERRKRLTALCHKLDLPEIAGDNIGFVPSRVDFGWKGHDLLLGALQRCTGREKLHLIFSGWGNDYGRAKDYVQRNGLSELVTFLPFSLSRPILAEFFSVADFAVDQFRFLGTYGTALVEALAAGCPTLMWIEESVFRSRGWESPPVMNAETEADIAQQLERIAQGGMDLDQLSRQSQAWVRRVHAPDAVLPDLMARFSAMQSTG
jgi:glycosyltransferase involved in cell wall biosynthesis